MAKKQPNKRQVNFLKRGPHPLTTAQKKIKVKNNKANAKLEKDETDRKEKIAKKRALKLKNK